jgi:hypothetical protein
MHFESMYGPNGGYEQLKKKIVFSKYVTTHSTSITRNESHFFKENPFAV